jgi:flagellin
MRVNTNINAMIASNFLMENSLSLEKSTEKISTALRITKAADDAAGLAVSEKMRSQLRGMQQNERNVQDAISLIQTADGALNEAEGMLQRMRELGVQGANASLGRDYIDKVKEELDQIGQELLNLSQDTKFNTKQLLSSSAGSFVIQSGVTVETRVVESVDLEEVVEKLTNGSIGDKNDVVGVDITLNNGDDGRLIIAAVDEALEAINTSRTELGSMERRLNHNLINLATSLENLGSSESRIRDIDVAKEMVELSRLNILNKSSVSMVSQTTNQPQYIRKLLM